MNADAYYEIGASHTVCEDYALAGVHEDMAYAIVCDGCSSSPDSDVGARIMAHIAKETLIYLHTRKRLYDPLLMHRYIDEYFKELVVKKALEVHAALHLSYDVFDTTLLMGLAIGRYARIISGFGDGHFILKKKNGWIHVISREYDMNAPYYLSYEMSSDKEQQYQKLFKDQQLKHTEYVLNKTEIPEDIEVVHKTDDLESSNSLCLIFREGDNVGDFIEEELSTSEQLRYLETEQIIVCSDGIGTYETNPRAASPDERESLSVLDVLPEIIAYKNMTGKFVERRMRRAAKDFAKQNIVHQDDISCAAIWVKEE